MLEINESVAVLTGRSGGIGLALARYSVQNGGKVVLADVMVDALAQAESEIKAMGGEVATTHCNVTYLNDKTKPYVQPLADELQASMSMRLDVARPGELVSVFAQIERQWNHLDILVHSIAFAPKEDLQGGLLDCSSAGFQVAMDISCHSFIRMARLAAPLMKA
jgi:enoyl-[acyl-carrier-protein] reductase (NADH)